MSSTSTCAGCGSSIDASTAELDEQGRPSCRACTDRATLATGQKRSSAAVSGAASTSAALALVSIFCGGIWVAVPAIVVGAGALIAARTADRLAPRSVPASIYLAAGVGMGIGLLRVLGFCLVVGAVAP